MAEFKEVLEKLTDILVTMQGTQNQILQNQAVDYSLKDNLQPYDEINENFNSYIQRLENHLELRAVDDSTPGRNKICVQILIGCLSAKMFQTLTKLRAPDLPKTKTYKEIIKLLRNYLSPQASEMAEQHKFYTRIQEEGETIQEYIAELRNITTHCNFSCPKCKASTIDTHLRAQFVRGVKDNSMRQRLLQQKDPTFDDVANLAHTMELSRKESNQMQPLNPVNAIRREFKDSRSGRKGISPRKYSEIPGMLGKCFRCSSPESKANKCPYKN